jgi:hypothetical protein
LKTGARRIQLRLDSSDALPSGELRTA